MYFIPKTIRLRDGTPVYLRSPEPERDARGMVDYLKAVCGETDFLSQGADEVALTAEQETAWLVEMNASPRGLIIVGELEGQTVASCHLQIGGKRRNAHRGQIGLSVRQAFWGRGLGSALMAELIGVARQKGLMYLELDVIEDNRRAIALYEKYGFLLVHKTPEAQRLSDGTFQTDCFMRKTL